MENNNDSMQEDFEKEISGMSEQAILDPAYRKRKLVMWLIRTIILAVLYVIFWNKYDWVKPTLYVAVPIMLISLVMIFAIPYFIKRKINKTIQKIEALDKFKMRSDELE